MDRRGFIWKFTPSRTPPELLEAIFVQRHDLLRDVVERVKESATTANKHHMLLVGPRGIGKTHFVSLVNHRVVQDTSLSDRLRIAWLNEDETTTSFVQLLIRIYRALSAAHPNEFPMDIVESLADLGVDEMTRQMQRELTERLGDHTALLIVENLNFLFEGLGESGQREWRAFLQENPVICTVATSQQLFDDVSQRENPFFGFFETMHLKPLTVDEAIVLLKQIADESKDLELSAYLAEPEGRSRVRALHDLAGGNHRVYIVLSEFVTRQTLDELVEPLQKMLDELTPYYQERLRALSPQQRQIVEFLCTQRLSCPVKRIARDLFATEQTVAGQLKKLRELGYVKNTTRGRESLYELTEPLMRLAFEVKETRGKLLRLVVDFLRIWYRREELERRLGQDCGLITRQYMTAALADDGEDPRLKVIQEAIDAAIEEGRLDEVIVALEEKAHATNAADDWSDLLHCMFAGKRYEEAIECFDRVLQLNPDDARHWWNKGVSLANLERYEDAIECYDRAIQLDPDTVLAWTGKGVTLLGLERYEEAIECYDRAIQLDPNEPRAAFYRCKPLLVLRRWREAIEGLRTAFADHATDPSDDSPSIVHLIHRNSDTHEQLREHVRELVSIYEEVNHLARLGDGLVRSLAKTDHEMMSEKALRALIEVWEDAGAGKPELEIPLRIYRVGIEYLMKQDERVLLDLLETERRIARQALGLKEHH